VIGSDCTHENAICDSLPGVQVGYGGVNTHLDGFAVLEENLRDHLARLSRCVDPCEGHEESLWALRRRPARSQTFCLCRVLLYEDVSLDGHLGVDNAILSLHSPSLVAAAVAKEIMCAPG